MTKKPVFYKIYFSFIAVFLVLLTVALIWLNGWLKAYESAQPLNLINSFVDDKLKNNDIDYLLKKCFLKISPYEKDENIKALFDSFIKDKKLESVVLATRPEGCDAAYTVKSNDKRFLNIYLKKIESSASFLPTYTVMSAEFDKELYKSVTISMPEGVEIKVNGIVLDNSHRTDTEIPEFVANYLKGEKVVKQQSAVIDYLLNDQVTVIATLDNKEIAVTKEGNSYSVYQYIDDNVRSKVQSIATEGSKAYAGYMQGDATLQQVATYFDTKCDFYKNIRSSYTDHILPHTPEGFDNVKNDEVFKYSDNVYSCKVQFTQVLKRNSMTYKIYFDKYVFLKKDGDSFHIIDIKSPENK